MQIDRKETVCSQFHPVSYFVFMIRNKRVFGERKIVKTNIKSKAEEKR